jgi:hypothetical protein
LAITVRATVTLETLRHSEFVYIQVQILNSADDPAYERFSHDADATAILNNSTRSSTGDNHPLTFTVSNNNHNLGME